MPRPSRNGASSPRPNHRQRLLPGLLSSGSNSCLAAAAGSEHHPHRIEQTDREYTLAKSQWSFKTAVELSAALAAKKVSAVELTEDAIARIERHDTKINAICVRDFERGLAAARAADAELARGVKKPLLGLPVTIKESYNVAGLPTTWGNPAQKDFRPAEDALPVSRIKEAGGVILGKTNVPIGLGDWQSYNEIYGTTNNPFDLGRTPGGSSGGSSAALAAGYGPLSIGSDIGGSLRVPAFHCGIYAHKPTFDLVAMRGHTPPPLPPLPSNRDLSVIGPMARGAADLTLLLDAIVGPDPLDAGKAYRLELPASRHRAKWRELFRTSDAVICPIMPTPAYPHDHSPDQSQRHIKIDGKDHVYSDQLAWPGIATLPGLPSTAIPTGFAPDGLPVGVQIVGPWLEDRTTLKLAELIEREFGGFRPPPMFDD